MNLVSIPRKQCSIVCVVILMAFGTPVGTEELLALVRTKYANFHEFLGNEIRCNGGQTCVWHTSESAFDGMFGCCPQSAYKQCSFFGTCYDSARLSASPSLKSNNPKSELYCTESDSPHCVTYMWTELSILDYNCGATKTTWTAVTWATTSLSEEWSVLATKIPATVDAPFLSLWSSETQTLSQTQSPMKAVPTSSSGQPGEPSTRPKVVSSSQVASKGSNSSTSAGTIAGSVVGGVLGVSGFAAAGFMFFLIRKRKRKGKSNTEAGAGQDGYQSVPRDGSPSGHDLHQSMNVYGPGTVKVNGAEEHDSKHNPSEVG